MGRRHDQNGYDAIDVWGVDCGMLSTVWSRDLQKNERPNAKPEG